MYCIHNQSKSLYDLGFPQKFSFEWVSGFKPIWKILKISFSQRSYNYNFTFSLVPNIMQKRFGSSIFWGLLSKSVLKLCNKLWVMDVSKMHLQYLSLEHLVFSLYKLVWCSIKVLNNDAIKGLVAVPLKFSFFKCLA